MTEGSRPDPLVEADVVPDTLTEREVWVCWRYKVPVNANTGGFVKSTDPETGDLEAWAEDVLDDISTYAGVSPSGSSLRLFGLGFMQTHKSHGTVNESRGEAADD